VTGLANASAGAPTGRSKLGRFLPGHKSIGGRKRGSRNLLSERFLADLHAQWMKSGKAVLEAVAQKEPATFLKVVAGVMPRLIDIEAAVHVGVHSELAVEVNDFAEAYKRWGQFIGAKGVPLIEGEVGSEDLVEVEDGHPVDRR
jgi:hypothetical protein